MSQDIAPPARPGHAARLRLFHRRGVRRLCGWLGAFAGMASALLADGQSNEPIGDPYPLVTCVVLDQDMQPNEETRVFVESRREIRVCCKDCIGEFQRNSYGLHEKIDQLIIHQQRDFYPLDKCIVDGAALVDRSFDHVFGNRLFRLCGDACKKKLHENPVKYFGILDDAVIRRQKPTYPLRHCVVSGKALDERAIDHVVANQLVRLADSEQIARLNQLPGYYVAKLRKAAKAASKPDDKAASAPPAE